MSAALASICPGTNRKNQVNSNSHFFGRSENKESMTADDDSGPAWAVPDYTSIETGSEIGFVEQLILVQIVKIR